MPNIIQYTIILNIKNVQSYLILFMQTYIEAWKLVCIFD